MIMLTKFNSKTNKKGEFVLNAEIIESIEETPDTVVTLTNGKKLIVEEPMEEIVRRTIKYRRALHQCDPTQSANQPRCELALPPFLYQRPSVESPLLFGVQCRITKSHEETES